MISESREGATPVYSAEQVTINDHTQLEVNPAPDGNFLMKPGGATHLRIQTLDKNIRYRLDGKQARSYLGFRLVIGEIVTLPVPNQGISLAGEEAGATIEYQWLR